MYEAVENFPKAQHPRAKFTNASKNLLTEPDVVSLKSSGMSRKSNDLASQPPEFRLSGKSHIPSTENIEAQFLVGVFSWPYKATEPIDFALEGSGLTIGCTEIRPFGT